MPKEIKLQNTSRAAAYQLWMKAPNRMVTFFKTLDVTKMIEQQGKERILQRGKAFVTSHNIDLTKLTGRKTACIIDYVNPNDFLFFGGCCYES